MSGGAGFLPSTVLSADPNVVRLLGVGETFENMVPIASSNLSGLQS